MKRKILLILCFLTFAFQGVSQTQDTLCAVSASGIPDCVRVNGGKFHVQGLAYDEQAQCMYFSFTSAFFKTDMKGNLIASIADINGHIGAMTFDKENRRVIASLEIKDDVIGRNIARKLEQEAWSREQAGFYLAVIDVDRLTRMDMRQEEVMTLVPLEEVCGDYQAKVNVGDKALEHRFACSGIDGVTIAPSFGAHSCGTEKIMRGENSNCANISCTRNCDAEVATKGGASSCASNGCTRKCGKKQRYVYVAYGVYDDTTRTDNDYNVLLAYRLEDVLAHSNNVSSSSLCGYLLPQTREKDIRTASLRYDGNYAASLDNRSSSDKNNSCGNSLQPLSYVHKYFVHTGNTEWGVQNLAYDSFTNQMFLAVYKGSKSRWPNYDLFALDMNQQSFSAPLEGVPYCNSPVEQLEVSGAWYFKWGSTGLCPLGDGSYYISHNGASDGNNYCEACLYRWQGSSSPDLSPFVPATGPQAGAN